MANCTVSEVLAATATRTKWSVLSSAENSSLQADSERPRQSTEPGPELELKWKLCVSWQISTNNHNAQRIFKLILVSYLLVLLWSGSGMDLDVWVI